MTDLDQIADLVRSETGIWVRDDQLPSLDAAVRRIALSAPSARPLAAVLRSPGGRALFEELIDAFTVKETFFFRQREQFDAIDWLALLELAHRSGSDRVRVWVAACATGEEAYTLGVLASEAFRSVDPPVRILGTDISASALSQACTGRYGRRALRSIDEGTRARHFQQTTDGVTVARPLRACVEFRQHNLARDPSPAPNGSSFELIACRNVLIYFDQPATARAIGLLRSALTPLGKLVLGAADRLCVSAQRLQPGELRPTQRRPATGPAGGAPRRARTPSAPQASARAAVATAHVAPATALDAALSAANRGDLVRAVTLTRDMLSHDPLDSDAHFVRGLAELGLGAPGAAIVSLRKALFVDGGFGLAAFQLGRAQEEGGDGPAAIRAYEQALRVLGSAPGDDPLHAAVNNDVDVGDVVAACRIRLRALGASEPGSRSAARENLGV